MSGAGRGLTYTLTSVGREGKPVLRVTTNFGVAFNLGLSLRPEPRVVMVSILTPCCLASSAQLRKPGVTTEDLLADTPDLADKFYPACTACRRPAILGVNPTKWFELDEVGRTEAFRAMVTEQARSEMDPILASLAAGWLVAALWGNRHEPRVPWSAAGTFSLL